MLNRIFSITIITYTGKKRKYLSDFFGFSLFLAVRLQKAPGGIRPGLYRTADYIIAFLGQTSLHAPQLVHFS